MKIQSARQNYLFFVFGIIAILALMSLPFFLAPNSKFGGSDNAGANAVQQIAPSYNAQWINNWWKPAPETESMLFALQAGIGGLLIGYAFGYLRGRKSATPDARDHTESRPPQ